MSGICGIVQPGAKPPIERLKAMLSTITLRDEQPTVGPAGAGYAMGASRRWDCQQTASWEQITVACDADLCNLDDISAEINRLGSDPDSLSLAECFAVLYRSHGLDFIKFLEGNFSFAIWDQPAQRLVLGVDRFCAKNLYWSTESNSLIFASRAGAVLEAQTRESQVNEAALTSFLILSVVPAPLSIYRGIERLEPGHMLIFERGRVKQQRYWDVVYTETKGKSERYWAEQVHEGIRLAVRRSLAGCERSTTGAYLSGGTDSSSVVAFMSEQFQPVNTFSIAFSESRYSEIEYARTTAGAFGTQHHEKFITADDAARAISRIIAYYDEPFANSSAVGAYYCALMAREAGMKTLLAGDGGDEIFAGNERYASDKRFQVYHSIPRWLRRGLIEPAAQLLPEKGKLGLPKRYIRRSNISNPRRVISYGVFLANPPEEIFEREFLRQAPPEHWLDVLERHHRTDNQRSELNRMMYTDVKITLGDNDLRKVAGTAELAGISVRYPLLDRELVELSAGIPSKLKMKGFKKRYIFKRAMREILPQKVLHKTKHGFGVPLALWLLQNPRLKELMFDVLNDSRTWQRGYFRPAFIRKLLDLHRTDHTAYYGEVIWYLLVLELWHRQHFEASREVAFAE
jgi:asparagine synthase (glutamine-hydrolysing)